MLLLLAILTVVALFVGALALNEADRDDVRPPPLDPVEQEDEFPDDN